MTSGEKEGDDERLKSLEVALDEALEERQEILEAASKEIDHHKTIALETEQKMMDDFEWKLREIEGEYRKKMRDLEASVDTRIKSAQDEYVKKKDSEFTRLSIAVRRDMEERKKAEIESVKRDLESRHKYDKEQGLTTYRAERDMELRVLQMSWDEEKNRLGRDGRMMQRKLDELPAEVAKAVRAARSEHDVMLHEERKKASMASDQNQEELDKLREEASGQMNRMRADYDERIRDLESRLENHETNRFSSMFQMKEEVEIEFTERMETLRHMYRAEIEELQASTMRETDRAATAEASLKGTISTQKKEIVELNTYYGKSDDEYDAKVNDLLTRLAEQTSLAQRLQTELDECEWYESDEEGGGDGTSKKGVGSRPSSARPPPVEQSVQISAPSQPPPTSNYLEPNPPPRARASTAASSESSPEQESATTSSNSYTYAKPNPMRFFYL